MPKKRELTEVQHQLAQSLGNGLTNTEMIYNKMLTVEDQHVALEKAGFDLRAIAIRVYDDAVTEANTDASIDWLVSTLHRFPSPLRWVVRKALDGLFPERFRGMLVRILYRMA